MCPSSGFSKGCQLWQELEMRRHNCPDGTWQDSSAASGAFVPSPAEQSGEEQRSHLTTLENMIRVRLSDGLAPTEPLKWKGHFAI